MESQKLAEGHKACKWARWELNLCSLGLASVNLTLTFGCQVLAGKLFSGSKNEPSLLFLTWFHAAREHVIQLCPWELYLKEFL